MDELAKSQIFTIRLGALTPLTPSGGDLNQARLTVGTIVDQKYEILDLLGVGGMGAVYRARHKLLNKEVALKTFNDHVQTEEMRERFQREAQSLAKLRHRNVVEIFDYGFQKDKTPFYTMEYLIGKSLAERIGGGKIMSVEQALPLFIQAAAGLAYVHGKGLVHRDLKPGNVFIEQGGNVKIVDFGIVATTAEQAEDQRLTRTSDGIIMGSPLYMSPEQASGLATGPASDAYSFGCALYECLTGRPPFIGNNALMTIMMHQNHKAPSLAEACGGDFSPQLELVIARLLAKDPKARFSDFEAVESSLKRCLQPGRVVANRNNDESTEGDAAPQSSNKLTYVVLGALLTITAAAAICFYTWRPQPKPMPVKLVSIESQAVDPKSGQLIGPLVSFVEPPKLTPALAKFPLQYIKGPGGENLVQVTFPTKVNIGDIRFQPRDTGNRPALGNCSWPVAAYTVFSPEQIFSNNPVNFDLLPALKLRGLDLRHADPITVNGAVMSRIGKMTTLVQFYAPKRCLRSDDLKYLDNLPLLRDLSIESSGISARDLARWPKLGQISQLNVGGIDNPREIIDRLVKDSKIFTLYIEHTALTHDDYKQIAAIKSLKNLIIADSQLDDTALQILADKSPGLKSLSSKRCIVSPTMLPTLKTMKEHGLIRLELYSTKFEPPNCRWIAARLPGVKCDLSPISEDITQGVLKSFTETVLK